MNKTNETKPNLNNQEKPDLIFGPNPNPKKFFRDGPMIPLAYYSDPETGELRERSPEVMRVMWDAYYATVGSDYR